MELKIFLFSKSYNTNIFFNKFSKIDSYYENSFLKDKEFDSSSNFKSKIQYPPKSTKTLDSVIAIISAVKDTSKSGCGIFSHQLMKNVHFVLNGGGCCSDFAQVFIFFTHLNKIKSREISNAEHTFNEFYSTDLGKWVFVDLNWKLIALDSKMTPLSVFEIKQRLDSKQSVNFYKVKNNKLFLINDLNEISPIVAEYYMGKSFNFLMITNGVNIQEIDKWNKDLSILPKSIRQFILLLIGIEPNYLIYEDGESNYFKPTYVYILKFFSFLAVSSIIAIVYRKTIVSK